MLCCQCCVVLLDCDWHRLNDDNIAIDHLNRTGLGAMLFNYTYKSLTISVLLLQSHFKSRFEDQICILRIGMYRDVFSESTIISE